MTDFEAINTIEMEESPSDEDMIAAVQQLVNTGMIWKLQGFYGRMATAFIERGYVHDVHAT